MISTPLPPRLRTSRSSGSTRPRGKHSRACSDRVAGTRPVWSGFAGPGTRSHHEGSALMPEKKPGPSVKDDELYEKLRDEGESKEKAARIANSAANTSRSEVGHRGGSSPAYED